MKDPKTLPQMRHEVLFQKAEDSRMGMLFRKNGITNFTLPKCLSAGCHVMHCQ